MFITFMRRVLYLFSFVGLFAGTTWLFVYQITDAKTANSLFESLYSVLLFLALPLLILVMGLLTGLLSLVLREMKEHKLVESKTNRRVSG